MSRAPTSVEESDGYQVIASNRLRRLEVVVAGPAESRRRIRETLHSTLARYS